MSEKTLSSVSAPIRSRSATTPLRSTRATYLWPALISRTRSSRQHRSSVDRKTCLSTSTITCNNSALWTPSQRCLIRPSLCAFTRLRAPSNATQICASRRTRPSCRRTTSSPPSATARRWAPRAARTVAGLAISRILT